MKKLALHSGIALACVTLLGTTPVHALKIYQLQGNQYAIICEDGTGYSFSGSANGAQEAGALLCDEHGGVVDIQNTHSANVMLKQRDRMGGPKPGSGAATRELDKASPKLME